MPTLRRSKPVRRIRQDPLPNAVQIPPPTDFSFSYRRGRDLAETARANITCGDADKADESKPAHDNFLSWAASLSAVENFVCNPSLTCLTPLTGRYSAAKETAPAH